MVERGAIVVEGLSKHYPVQRRTVWALRDASFTVDPGSALGVIGPNGAGKTTLLKLLARITPPSEGRAMLGGRVAPMIELASSLLQPELTGAQNVHLLARLFGVPQRVAERRLRSIFEFADLTGRDGAQARTYSSGQYRRLAFSVALNLEPHILLADEVLAVGDSGFRLRCFERVEAANKAGLTVVFASHDMDAVRRLCGEAIQLDSGRIVDSGSAEDVTARYESAARRPKRPADPGSLPAAKRRNFNEHVALLGGAIFAMDGLPVGELRADEDAMVSMSMEAATPGVEVRCVVVLGTAGKQLVRLVQPQSWTIERPGIYTASAHLPGRLLPPASYVARIGAWVTAGGSETALVRTRVFSVEVIDPADPDRVADEAEAPSVEEVTDLAWTVHEGDAL